MLHNGKHIGFWLMALGAILSGCSLIDEDQSDCGKDLGVNYELQLVTNVSTELQAKLGMSTEVSLSASMRTHLGSVFTDHADDVDLSFYDVVGDSLRLHHEQHQMDASRSSYTLMIPVRKYMHLAIANVMENGPVRLVEDETCHSATLLQEEADTVDSHRTGLFTARLPMDIMEGVDQQFDVHLYMANCATGLVLDTTAIHVKDIRVLATGFADSFSIADSVYHYRPGVVVRADKVEPDEESNEREVCFTAVSFPTRDVVETPKEEEPDTRVVIETDDFVEEEYDTEPVWQFHVFVTLYDGSITRTVLNVFKSVKAGQLMILKGRLRAGTGGVEVDDKDHTVAASVSVDWKEGLNIDVPL